VSWPPRVYRRGCAGNDRVGAAGVKRRPGVWDLGIPPGAGSWTLGDFVRHFRGRAATSHCERELQIRGTPLTERGEGAICAKANHGPSHEDVAEAQSNPEEAIACSWQSW